MARTLKILHIFGQMERGGAELRTLDVMRNIDRNTHQLHFCALSGRPGTLDQEICALGGVVHPIKLDLKFERQFRDLLRKEQFDVVHSHVHLTSGYLLRLADKERIPVRIAHFRNTFDGRKNTARRQIQHALLHYWIDRHATNILAVCEGAMQHAWGDRWQQDSRCKIIYNGLDPASFLQPADRTAVFQEFGLPDDSTLYIHIGRLVPQKNHLRLLDVFSAIASCDSNARLLIVGRGGNAIEANLRSMVYERGLDAQVIFAGERKDVPRLLKAADLMIFPSQWEGLPGAVLEACAVGTPVLASDLPGVMEIAVRLPLVHAMPLSASDAEWADVARKLALPNQGSGVRARAIKAFLASGFTVEISANQHCLVWRGMC